MNTGLEDLEMHLSACFVFFIWDQGNNQKSGLLPRWIAKQWRLSSPQLKCQELNRRQSRVADQCHWAAHPWEMERQRVSRPSFILIPNTSFAHSQKYCPMKCWPLQVWGCPALPGALVGNSKQKYFSWGCPIGVSWLIVKIR